MAADEVPAQEQGTTTGSVGEPSGAAQPEKVVLAEPSYPKGDKPARCARGHALGDYSVPSRPPPDGTVCGECGAEFDPTRKRAPRKSLIQAKALAPDQKPAVAAPPPRPSIEVAADWIKSYLAADKVTKRMADYGPTVKGLLADPLVRAPPEQALRARGVQPGEILIKSGLRTNPDVQSATEMLSRSVAMSVAAFIPSGAGVTHPLIPQAISAMVAAFAITSALRAPGEPFTMDMTVDPPASGAK